MLVFKYSDDDGASTSSARSLGRYRLDDLHATCTLHAICSHVM